MLLSAFILILSAVMIGCSSPRNSAVSPDLTQPSPVDLTGQNSTVGEKSNTTILWGLWDITIDPVSGNAEIVPLREAQWTVNVVKFLQPPAGKLNNLKVTVIDTTDWLTDGHIVVDVKLTHPFPGLYEYTGCDVRGVFIGSGWLTSDYNGSLTWSDGGTEDPYLANADGYTRWMNPTDFTENGSFWEFITGKLGMGSDWDATLNPYKYFTDNIGSEEDLYDFFTAGDNLDNRGMFTPGYSTTRRYDLYFAKVGGAPTLNYQYAVLASWFPADSIDPGDIPGSFPPEANESEPFLMHAVDTGTLYYTPTEAGGNLAVDLEIFDWAPFLGASSTVLDDISKIVIESPQGILPSPYVEFDSATLMATAVPGTTAASSIVSIDIAGCLPTDVDGQTILIEVEHASATYDNAPLGQVYPDGALTAYFFFTLSVSSIIPQGDAPVVTAIDPPHGLTGTYTYDFVITGDQLTGVDELKLVGDVQETYAENMVVVDDEHITCDFDLNGLDLGFYDVVASHPVNGEGALEDGFEVIECSDGIQDELTLYSTNTAFDPLFVAGVFTSGQYSGQIITQQGASAWNRINVADPPADNTPVSYYANKPSLSAMYNDWSWSLDCDPINQIFAYTTFDDDDESGTWPDTQFDFVKVCNQEDGSYVGACDTNCGYAVGQVDVDERGNIWAACSNAYYPEMSWTLQRWDYDPTIPDDFKYTKVGDWDISAYIGGDRCLSDIVVLQRYRRLYISCSNGWSPWGVRIHCWDISQDPPVHLNDALATQTGFYGTDSYQEVHQRFVDMEVDRNDDVLSGCRLEVMFMGQPSTNRTLELRKYDLDLNLLNQSSMEFFWDWWWTTYYYEGWFSNFVLDDQHDSRVVAIYDRFNNEAPNGIIGVTNKPSDW
ncbi:MAG: hypothetical protein ABIC40_02380 [bacterium]